MKLNTSHFGELEISEENIITFEEGVPGLPGHRYVLIRDDISEGEGKADLFFWLQSIDEPAIALVMMDVLKVMPDYDPLVDKDDFDIIGGFDPDSVFVYNVVVIPENIQKLSVNLKAPIVINDRTKRGTQVVSRNESYEVRHYIFEELNSNQGL